MARRNSLEIVEGYYVGHIVYCLHANKVLEKLEQSQNVADLATATGYDEEALGGLLDFLTRTTDILLRPRTNVYRLNPRYQAYASLGFHLDKFIGAYGPTVEQLDASLRHPGKASVDEAALAQAFTRLQAPSEIIINLLQAWGVTSLLDMGCGSAALLVELAMRSPQFKGWGVDASASMCKSACSRIRAAGVSEQVAVIQADARNLGTCFAPQVRQEITTLYCSSLLNEMCRGDCEEMITFLCELKRLFPAGRLFAVDYYGKLTHGGGKSAQYRHTLLQDVAQVISAQGVPPPNVTDWASIYTRSDCDLEHAYEGESSGIEWFVHVIRL